MALKKGNHTLLKDLDYVCLEWFDTFNKDDIKAAFDEAILFCKKIRLLRGSVYKVVTLDVTKGVSIDGESAVIEYRDINLLGDNNVKNVVFDGKNANWRVAVKGNNVIVERCSFLNSKRFTNGMSLALEVVNGVENVKIRRNTFDKAESFVKNVTSESTSGDDYTRFIRVQNCNNVEISNNVFKNMEELPLTVGECIHIQSTQINNGLSFPFSQGNLYFAELKNIKIFGNTFYAKNKGGIKVQAGGVEIYDNTFIDERPANEGEFSTHVRIQTGKNNVVRNNTFFSTHQNTKFANIYVSTSENTQVIGNVVHVLSGGGEAFVCIKGLKTSVQANTFNGVTDNAIFDVEYESQTTVKNNVFNITIPSATTYKVVDNKITHSVQKQDVDYTVTIEANVFNITNQPSNTIFQFDSNYIGAVSLIDNTFNFKNTCELRFTFRLVASSRNILKNAVGNYTSVYWSHYQENDVQNNTKIGSIDISEVRVGYIASVQTVNVRLKEVLLNTPLVPNEPLVFKDATNISVRDSDMRTTLTRNLMHILNSTTADISFSNCLFSTSLASMFFKDAAQDMQKITFTQTTGVLGLDFGTTAQRPTTKLNVGVRYFDTTLSKEIMWNGTSWLV